MKEKIVFDQEMIDDLSEVADKLTTKQLAEYFGIGQTTLFEIFKRQPEVYEAYKKRRSNRVVTSVSKLYEKIDEGDTTALLFYLKTQAGWKETQVVQTEEIGERPTRIILEAADGRDTETTA